MGNETVVIEIVTRTKDETGDGVKTASETLSKLEEQIERLKKMSLNLGVSASTSQASSSLDRVQKQADRLNGSDARIGLSVRDLATATISKVSSGVKDIAGRTFTFAVKVLDYATTPLRSILNFATSLKGIITGIVAGTAVKQSILEPMTLYQDMQMANIGFTTQMGEETAKSFMQQVREFAIRTPFETSNTIKFSRMMLNAGWSQETVLDDLAKLGDLTTAFGYGDYEMESIIRAFSQIRSKGVLSAEEMTRQLGEKIPAWRLLALGLGYGDENGNVSDAAIQKVKEMAENREIGAEMGIQAMMKAMEQYSGTMDTVARETLSGIKSIIKDTFTEKIIRRWGEGLNGGVLPGMQKLLKLVEDNEDKIAKFGDTLYDIGKQLSTNVVNHVETIAKRVSNLFGSVEFQSASLGGKVKMLLNEVFVRDITDWWNSRKGHLTQKLEGLAESVGNGMGKFYSTVIKAIFGFKDNDIVDVGTSVGAGFIKGFKKAFDDFDFNKVVIGGIKNMFSDALKLLPGGKDPTGSSLISAAMLTYGASKLGLFGLLGGAFKTAGRVITGKSLINAIIGSSKGSGLLGLGGMTALNLGADAANTLSLGSLSALGLGGIAGGITGGVTLLSGLKDVVNAFSEQNLGKGIGGALKIAGSVGGAALGAKIGAGIGTIGGPLGTLIGTGIGSVAGILISKLVNKTKIDIEKDIENYNTSIQAAKDTVERSGSIDNLLNRYEELQQKIDDTSTPVDIVTEAYRKQNEIVQQLSELFPGLISAYETEHGLMKTKIDALRQMNELEKERTKLETEDKYDEWNNKKNTYKKEYNDALAESDALRKQKEALESYQSQMDVYWGQFNSLMQEQALALDTGDMDRYDKAWEKIDAIIKSVNDMSYDAYQKGVTDDFYQFTPRSFSEIGPDYFQDMIEETRQSLINALARQQTAETAYSSGYSLKKQIMEIEMGSSFEDLAQYFDNLQAQGVPIDGEDEIKYNLFIENLEELYELQTELGNLPSSVTVPINIVRKYTTIGQTQAVNAEMNANAARSRYESGIYAFATGDIISRPTRALIGEAGPEAVIPLSSAKRNRGLSLWEQAGELLGADVGVPVGVPAVSSSGGGDLSVNLGGISLTVQASGNGGDIVSEIKKALPELTDEICKQIAKALGDTYSNMAKAGGVA